jgi:hypothetical protein
MHGTSKSNKEIEIIDLTKDDHVKEEPVIGDYFKLSICRYTCKILIENEVSILHSRPQLTFFIRHLKKLVLFLLVIS